jgi:hypothetical protein
LINFLQRYEVFRKNSVFFQLIGFFLLTLPTERQKEFYEDKKIPYSTDRRSAFRRGVRDVQQSMGTY